MAFRGLLLPREARIKLRYAAESDQASAIAEHAEYVKAETLALEFARAASGEGEATKRTWTARS